MININELTFGRLPIVISMEDYFWNFYLSIVMMNSTGYNINVGSVFYLIYNTILRMNRIVRQPVSISVFYYIYSENDFT